MQHCPRLLWLLVLCVRGDGNVHNPSQVYFGKIRSASDPVILIDLLVVLVRVVMVVFVIAV